MDKGFQPRWIKLVSIHLLSTYPPIHLFNPPLPQKACWSQKARNESALPRQVKPCEHSVFPANLEKTKGLAKSLINPLPEKPPRCRVLQGFLRSFYGLHPRQAAALNRVQKCRKNDLFSPQASWGDNCARRVLVSTSVM